jgi:mannose-1-phosphate guanylyltransferase
VNRWVVILAGGVGSRFWPLSTPQRPKQLLPLVTGQALLVDAIQRVAPLAPPDRILILTSAGLADDVWRVSGLPRENIIAEPYPAGTAAALTWGAMEIVRRGGGGAIMISLHADWAIADPEGFRDALLRAEEAAEAGNALVTVGIVPDRADPGFGYIMPGADAVSGSRAVDRFVEKPGRQRAADMVREGCLWNSGIFVWRAADFLAEVRAHTLEVSAALATESASMEEFFSKVTPVSVDVGVLERSSKVLVIPGDFGWDDVGTWGALRRVRSLDDQGNAIAGGTFVLESSGNVVHAEGTKVVLFGVHDLVVVSRPGLTLVTTVDRSAELKTLVDALPGDLVESS